MVIGQGTYYLHKSERMIFPRNPYTVSNVDDVWEMDLAGLSSLSKYNVLNVIDIFSRFSWSVPLKDKIGSSITAV